MRSLECAEATTTSSSSSSVGLLIDPAVLEDVHLDPGEQGEAVAAHAGDDLELLAEPLRRQAVRNPQPRRMIGECEVLVAERTCRIDHEVDGGQSVRPVAVGVEVPAEQAQGGGVLTPRARAGP